MSTEFLSSRCPSAEEIGDYAVGKLTAPRCDAVDGHLQSCARCQAELETCGDQDDTMLHRLRAHQPEDLEASFEDESACAEMVAQVVKMANPQSVSGGAPEFASIQSARLDDAPTTLTIGPYRLVGKLGSGGMGTVYEAVHTKLKRTVALKMLPAERTRDAQAVTRFEREMEAVGRLDHPNIVRAHDAGEFRDRHFLVMEHVHGVDASDLVRQHGPLRIADACELVRQAAVGLEHAHQFGLVHRDIKPSNLMVTPQGEVKILDLGLALLPDMHATDSEELTNTGQAMGTLDYMAPEQANNSHTVDLRADIYALGATLYKLLTGATVYSGPDYKNVVDKWQALTGDEPVGVAQRCQDVLDCQAIPPELTELMERMLAKSPEQRPQTAGQLADQLQAFTDSADLSAVMSGVSLATSSGIGSTSNHLASAFTGRKERPRKQAAPDTSSAPGRPLYRSRWVIGVLALLIIGGSITAWQITIHIRAKNGQETVIQVPGDSEVIVEAVKSNSTPVTEREGAPPPIETAAVQNMALRFDGRATAAFIPSLQYHGQYPLTVEGWCRPTSDARDPVFISDAFGPGFTLKFSKASGWKFLLANPRGWKYSETPGGGELNEWTHVAGVWDWKEMRLYVNGHLKTTLEFPRSLYYPSRREVAIGSYPAGDHPFVGLVDEVRISNEAIYQKDFVPEKHLVVTTATVALFRFNEGSGSKAIDASGNGHDAMIRSSQWSEVNRGEPPAGTETDTSKAN